jgi:hypothetical protein
MANTYLTRTPSSNGNLKICTWSGWVKRSKLGTRQILFSANNSGTGLGENIEFTAGDKLEYDHDISGTDWTVSSDMLFRDTSAWYHIVFAKDTTQATESDRIKIYVNGTQISLTESVNGYPTQNYDGFFNNTGYPNYIGVINNAHGDYFDGSMSHIHFIDGTAYDASAFGETDSTTGEWKIKTSPSVTYGTNGFFILKDGNSVTDQSGNGNNFTVAGGTLTKTEDSPSNVFCVLNKLQKPYPSQSNTLTFGNTKYADNNASWQRQYGTIGATTGKYFYEFKPLNISGTSDNLRIGWDSIDSINEGTDNYYSGITIDTAGILRGGEDGYNGYDPNAVQMSAAYSGGNFSFTTGDILGMAIDIDNNKFSVYKNGNLEIDNYSYASASNCSLLKSKGHFIAPSVNWYSSTGDANRGCFNFGNGYFETTAVSSAGTNASGNGIFEYDVPTGYTALSTKGLNL